MYTLQPHTACLLLLFSTHHTVYMCFCPETHRWHIIYIYVYKEVWIVIIHTKLTVCQTLLYICTHKHINAHVPDYSMLFTQMYTFTDEGGCIVTKTSKLLWNTSWCEPMDHIYVYICIIVTWFGGCRMQHYSFTTVMSRCTLYTINGTTRPFGVCVVCYSLLPAARMYALILVGRK